VLSVVKNVFLDKDIINYLKYVCFKIDKTYCFEFDATDNDGDHVHLLVGAETKYFSLRVIDCKRYHRNKN
jgi:REP element-mobilizing transposase RayT